MAVLTLSGAKARINAHLGKTYVYTLHRPSGEPFYVGIGTRGRISCHEYFALGKRAKGTKLSVIRKITTAGNSVGYSVKFFRSRSAALREECRLIRVIGRRDQDKGPLLNFTDGGDGTVGRSITASYRKKLSKAMTGRTHTTEVRAKLSRSTITMWQDKKFRAKCTARMKEAAARPERRRQLSRQNKGLKRTASFVRRIKQANTGLKRTNAARKKYSAVMQRCWNDPVWRARRIKKIRAATRLRRR